MQSAKTFVVTGATQGLGLGIARALAANPAHDVVLAVRDVVKGEAVARAIGANARVARIDCASLADVRRFAAAWSGPIAGLVNNAGVQQTAGMQRSADGFEETIAVNHLAAFELTIRLLPFLEGGRVLFIGSGTHDPNHRSATRFGFRGARFTSIEALAKGEADPAADDRQRGMDRYATSKLLNTVTAMELARRIARERTAFFTLDPGLMAGTGLARSNGALLRFAWSYVLPLVAPLLPDTSTTERSGATAARLLTDPDVIAQNGEVFSFDRKPATHVSRDARDPALARAVVDQTLALLGLGMP